MLGRGKILIALAFSFILFAMFVYAWVPGANGASTEVPIPLTNENLALLKGIWEGKNTYAEFGDWDSKIIIRNDTLPLEGEVINKTYPHGENTYPFDNGRLENGRLVISWVTKIYPAEIKVGLYEGKGGKLKLKGEFSYPPVRAGRLSGPCEYAKK